MSEASFHIAQAKFERCRRLYAAAYRRHRGPTPAVFGRALALRSKAIRQAIEATA